MGKDRVNVTARAHPPVSGTGDQGFPTAARRPADRAGVGRVLLGRCLVRGAQGHELSQRPVLRPRRADRAVAGFRADRRCRGRQVPAAAGHRGGHPADGARRGTLRHPRADRPPAAMGDDGPGGGDRNRDRDLLPRFPGAAPPAGPVGPAAGSKRDQPAGDEHRADVRCRRRRAAGGGDEPGRGAAAVRYRHGQYGAGTDVHPRRAGKPASGCGGGRWRGRARDPEHAYRAAGRLVRVPVAYLAVGDRRPVLRRADGLVRGLLGPRPGGGQRASRRRRRLLFVVLTGAAIAISPLSLAMVLPLPAVCVASFALGVFVEMLMVQWTVTMTRNIPPDKLARVSSYDVLGSVMAMPAGALIAGPLGTAIGTSRAQYAAAAVIVVASALALIPRDIRTIRNDEAGIRAGAAEIPLGGEGPSATGVSVETAGTAGAPVVPRRSG